MANLQDSRNNLKYVFVTMIRIPEKKNYLSINNSVGLIQIKFTSDFYAWSCWKISCNLKTIVFQSMTFKPNNESLFIKLKVLKNTNLFSKVRLNNVT